ncbi:MAG: sulfatase [Deltaproteobacteria bacterium]|nr:MAG: sulfatase [Deltaproteobacteria bacterium]
MGHRDAKPVRKRAHPTRNRALGGGALAALGALLLVGVVSARSQPPNVILVVIDTLRADHLSHFGYALPTATGLDAFAGHATRFTRAYPPSSWTGPSTASIFTGLFSARHRVDRAGTRLSDEFDTLAEVLARNGWHTVGYSLNHNVSTKTGYHQGFDRFDDFLGGSTAYPHIEEMIGDLAQWLERGPRQPFFLYLHPMNTHGPYRVPPDRQTALLGRRPSRAFSYYRGHMGGITSGRELERRARVSDAYVASLVEQYDTAIRYTTDELGRLFEMLKRQGLYDDSLIIVTSDHGEELFDHGGFSHGYSLHEEVLRVPLYVKLPRQRETRTVRARVSVMDLYPTVLEALGIPVEGTLDGVSLLPLLRGSAEAAARAADRTLLYQINWPKRCIARSIVSQQYKLIEIDWNYEGAGGQTRLYDLAADPRESVDLSGARPELLARLRGELDAAFRAFEDADAPVPANVLDELDAKRLEALGYF